MNYGNMNVGEDMSYSCRVMPWGKLPTIGIVFSIIMMVVYATVFLGLPLWLVAVVLFGVAYGSMWFLTSDATFVLGKNEINRSLHSEAKMFSQEKEKSYLLSQIRSYENGKDRGRYRGEYQYLRLFFDTDEQWEITDMYGERKEIYDLFLQAFLEKVGGNNKQIDSNASNTVLRETVFSSSPQQKKRASSVLLIERRKSFYEKPTAKIVTIVLTIFVVGILYFMLQSPQYLKPTLYFKVFIVLLPGIIYLWYRTFFLKKED